MVRSILALALLLVPFPGNAADVPLSDRPLAPLRVNAFDAAAAPDAVLLAFTSGADVYAQRLTPTGEPLDPTAFYLATPGDVSPRVTVLWDGARWAVLWANGMVWIDRDGGIDGPHETAWWTEAAVLGESVVVATGQTNIESQLELRLAELTSAGGAVTVGDLVLPLGHERWIVGVDRGIGALTWREAWAGGSLYNVTLTLITTTGESRNFFIEHTIPGSKVRFLASRDGGGLLLWNRDGLRGMIFRGDLTATQPFAIGPAGTPSGEIAGTSRAGGWDVLFRPGSLAHIARIASDGTVDIAPLDEDLDVQYWWTLVRSGASNLLFLPREGSAPGLFASRITGTAVDAGAIVAIGEAAQSTARSAAGNGVELVVWEERAADGLVLKATRVLDGQPLDGAGLPVAAHGFDHFDGSLDRFDVAFDGERFVVAWIEGQQQTSQLFARTITAAGELSAPVRIVEQGPVERVSVAGGGGGRAAIAWVGWGTDSWLVPFRGGAAGARVTVGPVPPMPYGRRISVPRLAASADRYLAVFAENFECRITCAADGRAWAQPFSLDGEALSEPKPLSNRTSLMPEVVSDGRDFFVEWWGYGHVLARVGPQLEILDETTLVRFGELSIDGAELRIDAGSTRAVYSLEGHLIRFEPLPLIGRETLAARLAHGRALVRTSAHPDRLVIRPLADPAGGTADIAIVPTGRVDGPLGRFEQVAFFRIEHRGGVPVRRLELWSEASIYVPVDIPYGATRSSILLERPLSAGESSEVGLNVQLPAYSRPLHVTADAIDLVPANNVAQHGAEPRPRRRAVRREP